MYEALARAGRELLAELRRVWYRERGSQPQPHQPEPPRQQDYQTLERVVLTDGVGRTLFEEYAAHRAEARSEEETGWVLLGYREPTEAVVLATLPAGAERDAGVAHVQFNSGGQELGARIVRQADRRLTMLGV